MRVGKVKLIFEKQAWHYSLLVILLAAIFFISQVKGLLAGQFFDIGTSTWLYLGIVVAILHQVYVWFCWRVQLHFSLITKIYGQNGFLYYSIGFLILFILRFVLVIILAISNMNTLNANQLLLNILALLITTPAFYLFYSVMKYFTIERALGIDHFALSYAKKPFVREGIFKFTSNGMYIFGLLIFWVPGLLFSSQAALLLALFNHIYVWIHYYVTERPDIRRIYSLSRHL